MMCKNNECPNFENCKCESVKDTYKEDIIFTKYIEDSDVVFIAPISQGETYES